MLADHGACIQLIYDRRWRPLQTVKYGEFAAADWYLSGGGGGAKPGKSACSAFGAVDGVAPGRLWLSRVECSQAGEAAIAACSGSSE